MVFLATLKSYEENVLYRTLVADNKVEVELNSTLLPFCVSKSSYEH